MEDMFEAIKQIHVEQNHLGRTPLYKRISRLFHGITERICQIFVSHCEVCQLKKSRKSVKSLVIKPISSSSYLSRGQIDLIDFSTIFPEQNQPYKWLLVYQDHFTKFVRLRALINKTAEEVAEALIDFFSDMGAPLILQSDNGREFKNKHLFKVLNDNFPSTRIIHGKPRHPETQGAVERANQGIKRHFTAMMLEKGSNSWVHFVR